MYKSIKLHFKHDTITFIFCAEHIEIVVKFNYVPNLIKLNYDNMPGSMKAQLILILNLKKILLNSIDG